MIFSNNPLHMPQTLLLHPKIPFLRKLIRNLASSPINFFRFLGENLTEPGWCLLGAQIIPTNFFIYRFCGSFALFVYKSIFFLLLGVVMDLYCGGIAFILYFILLLLVGFTDIEDWHHVLMGYLFESFLIDVGIIEIAQVLGYFGSALV